MQQARPLASDAIATARAELDALVQRAATVILGKQHEFRLAFACLLARGHLLIEDLPGVGKTTLAHLLARLLGLTFSRVQFTSDLMPSDILGVSIYLRDENRFEFHPGPVFAQVLLADEVNRATPRTQSALLEAMAEGQVTVEGTTHPLPQPFFVIATQNPSHQIGTYPLPESQLDRFLMRLQLGYPDAGAERELLEGEDRQALLHRLMPAMAPERLLELQELVGSVHCAPALLDYLQALIEYSRRSQQFTTGLSPRAGLALLQTARAWALLAGRDHALPEDVQAVLPSVVGHRLRGTEEPGGSEDAEAARVLLSEVAVP